MLFKPPLRFKFVLDAEYFNGLCNAAAKTGCLSVIPSEESVIGSVGEGIRFFSIPKDKLFENLFFDSKGFELLPFSCFSRALVKLIGPGVLAAEEVGEEEDEFVEIGWVCPKDALDSFFSFLILGLNSVMTTVKSSTVTL